MQICSSEHQTLSSVALNETHIPKNESKFFMADDTLLKKKRESKQVAGEGGAYCITNHCSPC